MISLNDSSSLAAQIDSDDADPMSSVANVVDCMLVFACGLMLALIAYWNMVLPSEDMVQLNKDQMQEVQDVQQVGGQLTVSGNSYRELGTVYQDPTTGKLYMLAEQADQAQATADAATTSAENSTSGGATSAENATTDTQAVGQ